MVKREDDVEGASQRLHEDRVGGVRAADVDALCARAFDGADDLFFLVSELAAFSGVRIEPCDADLRGMAVESREFAMEQSREVEELFRCDVADRFSERHVYAQ